MNPTAVNEFSPSAPGGTRDPAEIERFDALAEAWWDPHGEFRPLHRLNPLRLAYIRDRVTAHFGRDAKAPRPLAGLRVVDIGCGGGLLTEPMTRLGAQVVGVDAGEAGIEAARRHAAESRLEIDYRRATAEELAAAGESFDLVVNMEVIEHVADRDAFLEACCGLIVPGGAMVLSTLNRTPKSFLLGIVAAEYVLGWLPRGTHDWRKFVRPAELEAGLRRNGVRLVDVSGMVYNPVTDRWRLGRDAGVNYLAFATKPAARGARRPRKRRGSSGRRSRRRGSG